MIPGPPAQFTFGLFVGTRANGWVKAWSERCLRRGPLARKRPAPYFPEHTPTLLELSWGDVMAARDAFSQETPTRAIVRGDLKIGTVYRDEGPRPEFGRQSDV